MKFTIAAFAGAAMLVSALPAAAQVNERQSRQQQRIHQGIRSGEVTRREYQQLQRQQSRIDRYEQQSRRDGGGLNYRERQRLDRMQDRAGQRIRSQKHDRQDRYRPR